MSKLIVAGTRTFNNKELLFQTLDDIRKTLKVTEIVSGCAKGADSLGELYAETRNIPIKKFPADWEHHGRKAGPMRNRQMAEYGDALVIFWNGKSSGTRNMWQIAEYMGLDVMVVTYED